MSVAHSLIVDNFAGGGGASTGIEAALGRAVDIAINHDEQAIRMHEVNHPGTRHIRNNIWQIDPREVTGGQHVGLAWFSPDCKHFSKAKGGKPREKSIRDLAWVVVLWAERVKPDVILLENVEEFRTWGPLCEEGKPIKERMGETFEKWTKALRKAGYRIQWKELRACDYGAPTIRKRFFMIARRDGKPIVWPKPTHGKPGSPDVLSGRLKPWRTAAEIIDWSIPCPSIFDRKKPLAEKTLRRIAHGIMKFVVNNPSPFIVPICNTNWAGDRFYPGDEPLRTITTAKGGEMAVIAPHITKFRNGAIGHDMTEPLATVTANSFVKRPGGSAPLGIVEASLRHADFYCGGCGEGNDGTWWPTCEWCGQQQEAAAVAPVIVGTAFKNTRASRAFHPQDPLRTLTAQPEHAVAAAHLVHIGNGEREGQAPRAMDVEKPLGTVVAGGTKHAAVTAFMQKFAENGKGYDPSEPLHTVMAGAPRHAVICAHIEQANGGPNNENLAGRSADDPLSTVATSGSQQRLVTSNLVKLRGTCAHGQPTEEPLHTISAGGTHMAEVRAFLLKYYSSAQHGQELDDPLHTLTHQARFGLVTVMIEGEEYVIVDIGMRMLSPRELFNAQGFPPDYIIDHDAEGKPITKTAQVAKCGNSVCPPIAEALVRANCGEAQSERAVA